MRLPLYFFLVYSLLVLSSCGSTDEREIVEIPEGKVGMIGYGSLTSKAQLDVQLGRMYEDPLRLVHLKGYQRFWSAVFPNDGSHPPVDHILSCQQGDDTFVPKSIVALNIEETPGKEMNCFFFIINEEELAVMDRTEKGYERFDVADSLAEIKVTGGPVYAYRASEGYHRRPVSGAPRTNVIPRLYLGFFRDAFIKIGEDYEKEFRESSEHYDESLVLDCEQVIVE